MELKDKVVVITGGSGGIGRAMAKAFLAEGAKAVMLADLDEAAVAAAAREIGCDGMACDVTQEAQVQELVRRTVQRHGPVDWLGYLGLLGWEWTRCRVRELSYRFRG